MPAPPHRIAAESNDTSANANRPDPFSNGNPVLTRVKQMRLHPIHDPEGFDANSGGKTPLKGEMLGDSVARPVRNVGVVHQVQYCHWKLRKEVVGVCQHSAGSSGCEPIRVIAN